MMGIIFASLMIVVAIVLLVQRKLPRALAIVPVLVAGVSIVGGAISYNDAGYCVHIRTIFGSETSKCDLGWYFSGWGNSTQWPHYITVGNVADATEVKSDSISTYLANPYRVKLADNWAGDITQSTRFGLPQNEEKFLKMARDFRTPENLIRSTLVQSVNAALDTTANLFTMEEYYSGGQRDAFKNEYRDTIMYGPAVTEKITDVSEIQKRVAPSSSENVQDTSDSDSEINITIVEKKTDKNGQDIRNTPPGYTQYGITVSTAIVENLNPDDAYEAQVVKRKEALGRRVIARDQRLEQEEQRLLKIAEADSAIAEEQGRARQEQIKQTTNAETSKKLALIESEKMLERAALEKKTSQINLEKAEIDAKSIIITAEAEAKKRQLAISADNALQAKLDAEVQIQTVWANAYATRAVPSVVFGSDGNVPVGSDSEASNLIKLLTAETAKNLAYDRNLNMNDQK